MFIGIFGTGIAIYGIKLINVSFGFSRNSCISKWFTIICSSLEFAAYITLTVLYCIALANFNQIDSDMMTYARDNKCSDAVLQRSIDVYASSFEHDKMLASLGLFFVLISFFGFIMIVLFMGCKSCMSKCFGISNEPSAFERRMSTVHDKYTNFFSKREEAPINPQSIVDPNLQGPPPVDILGDNNFDQQPGAYPVIAQSEIPSQRNLFEPSQIAPLPGYDRNPQEFVLSEPPKPTPIQP